MLCQSRNREYVLLRNYRENIIARGFLIRLPFYALEQIESNSWYRLISDEDKPRVRSIMQIDIVSKMMMYIEDLAILSESFGSARDFYEIITDENIDIGEKTGNFINDVEAMTFKRLSQIMCYFDIDQISSDELWIGILKKHLDYHTEKIRKGLRSIASFSKANHIFYKRFKHAGMPIFRGFTPKGPASPPLDKFESFSLVAEGPNPFEDTVVIPYSKLTLKRYEIVINELQSILLEMTENRIECLKRSIPGIIPVKGQAGLLSSQETELMDTKIDEFYYNHPIGEIPTNLAFNTNIKFEKVQWYIEDLSDIGGAN